MVKLTNHNIVQHLVTLFEDIENETLRHDKKIHCTDDTYLLVDSGKVGTSIILNEATRLVREAKKISNGYYPDHS